MIPTAKPHGPRASCDCPRLRHGFGCCPRLRHGFGCCPPAAARLRVPPRTARSPAASRMARRRRVRPSAWCWRGWAGSPAPTWRRCRSPCRPTCCANSSAPSRSIPPPAQRPCPRSTPPPGTKTTARDHPGPGCGGRPRSPAPPRPHRCGGCGGSAPTPPSPTPWPAAGSPSRGRRQICDWTDQLPEDARDNADQILLGAAAGGAELADLARLAEEMRRRLAEPDDDGDDGFEDRQVRLQTTLGGAGRLDGDLTPALRRSRPGRPGRAGQEGRARRHQDPAAATSRCAGRGVPAADRQRRACPTGPGSPPRSSST